MGSLFLLLGCNLSYIVDLFAALHELASASARTLLKLASSVRALLKPYWATLIATISLDSQNISRPFDGFVFYVHCRCGFLQETRKKRQSTSVTHVDILRLQLKLLYSISDRRVSWLCLKSLHDEVMFYWHYYTFFLDGNGNYVCNKEAVRERMWGGAC